MDVHLNRELEQKLVALAAQTGRAPEALVAEAVAGFAASASVALDWSRCPIVESIPGKVSGAWVFKGTRMPVSIVFQNLEAGATIEEIAAWFDVTVEQVKAVIEFAARSLEAPVPGH